MSPAKHAEEKTLICADPGHIQALMLVARSKAGSPIVDRNIAASQRKVITAGIKKWCKANNVDMKWTGTPGAKTKGREYRVAYRGLETEEALGTLLDQLDAELRRLMLLDAEP